jgi:DUF1680 family protein
VSLSINGQPHGEPVTNGEFVTLVRQWKSGDEVNLDMLMEWRLVLGRKRQSGRVAVMRGPVVFCLNPAQNETLRSKHPLDLDIMIDPKSLHELPDDSIHPNGVACQVRAGDDLEIKGVSGNLSLKLTEFADPNGKVTYFRLDDLSIGVTDELLTGGSLP